jgi:hypothetical protein
MSEELTIKPFDHATVCQGVAKLRRGLCWCTTCGRCHRVDPTNCFRHGWPKCCGFTMTIDSPDERAAITNPSTEPAK